MPKRVPSPSTSPKTLEMNDARDLTMATPPRNEHSSFMTSPPTIFQPTTIAERPITDANATNDDRASDPRKEKKGQIVIRDRLSEPRKDYKEPTPRRATTP
jgi:hypothetical protein